MVKGYMPSIHSDYYKEYVGLLKRNMSLLERLIKLIEKPIIELEIPIKTNFKEAKRLSLKEESKEWEGLLGLKKKHRKGAKKK